MISVMREVNLAGVDLNLLPALEALIRCRNVTRAGEAVGLSQPAMSRALARLRDLLADPILVKAPGGLAPTARAQALLPELTAALDGLGGVVRPSAFDPKALDRVFRVVGADVHSLLLGPPLLAALAAVGATDCVTVLSAALARRFAQAFALQLYETPLKQKAITLTTVAAATRAQDPTLMWLRARLREIAAQAYG